MKKLFTKRNLIVSIATIVIAGGLIAGYIAWQRHDVEVKKQAAIAAEKAQLKLDSQTQAKEELTRLEKNKPSVDAPVNEKVNYHSQVAAMEAVLGEYDKAIASYKEAEKLSGGAPLSISIYLAAARAYAATGDRAMAQSILDKADTAAALETDEAYRASAKRDIERIREEIL